MEMDMETWRFEQVDAEVRMANFFTLFYHSLAPFGLAIIQNGVPKL